MLRHTPISARIRSSVKQLSHHINASGYDPGAMPNPNLLLFIIIIIMVIILLPHRLSSSLLPRPQRH